MAYKIGIITYDRRALPATYKLDDYLLKEALTLRGAEAAIFSWTNAQIDLTTFDALVLRSCWDSHRNPPAFLHWLKQSEADRPRLINPAPVLFWNYFKEQYLYDLATSLDHQPLAQGKIVPSVFYSAREASPEGNHIFRSALGKSLASILQELEIQDASLWCGQDIIIKPTISAAGENTICVVRRATSKLTLATDVLSVTTAETPMQEMLQNKTWPGIIIQPLLNGIQQGEYSLIYIAGKFSHAVHKRVAANDFKSRLETERVGIQPDALPPNMLAFGAQVMALAQSRFPACPILYARIDMVQDVEGMPVLLECELLEPHLQFTRLPEIYYGDRHAPTQTEIKQGEVAMLAAMERFAKAIITQTTHLQEGRG